MVKSSLFILCTCWIAAIPCSARTILVSADGTGDLSTRLETGYPTIQAAIDAAVEGDTVELQPGVYTGEGNRDIGFKGKTITVRSIDPHDPNVVAATIINCNGTVAEPHRGFTFRSGETPLSVLSGLTITNGYGPKEVFPYMPSYISVGGAIACEDSSPTITYCQIRANRASGGDGIFCRNSNPTIHHCSIIGNPYTSRGGGVYLSNSNPTITDCAIIGNKSSSHGGGICCEDSAPVITGCLIADNSAEDYGGGIFISTSVQYSRGLTIDNCIIAGNQSKEHGGGIFCASVTSCRVRRCFITDNAAYSGGGIFCSNGREPMITECIISNNWASYRGGGIACLGTGAKIHNCTVIDNGAGTRGGGFDYLNTNFTNILSNCILRDNTAPMWPQVGGTSVVGGSIIKYNNVEGGYENPGNMDSDPQFAIDGYHLLPQSPCIDEGDPNTTRTPQECDIDNQSRIIGARIDLGADEVDANSPPLIGFFPRLLKFTVPDTGPNSPPQSLHIYNVGSGSLNWQIMENCPWLSVTPITGTTSTEPNEVALIVDAAGLERGMYDCRLIISDPNCTNDPQTGYVLLTVMGPRIELSQTQFTFKAGIMGPNPPDQVLTIRNSGCGTLNWQLTYSDECSWLRVSPKSDIVEQQPSEVVLSVDQNDLKPGLYQCTLTISDPNAENNPQIIDISLTVAHPKIGLSPGSFTFIADSPVSKLEAEKLLITNIGAGVLDWQITYDCNWVDVYPLTGRSAGESNEVIVTVNLVGLQRGSYNCTLTVSDQNASNSPVLMTITLEIGPEIYCYPSSLIFDVNSALTRNLYVSRRGAGILNWQITTDCNWISVYPSTGQLPHGGGREDMIDTDTVTVTVNPVGLGQVVNRCILTISDPNAWNSPQTIAVYYVSAGACLSSRYSGYPEFTDWVILDGPECWCWKYQCDGDTDNLIEGAMKYRVYTKDLDAVVKNWKKKIADPTLNPCADIDHRSYLEYRVYTNDLSAVVNNWKKKDAQLPGNCPRLGGR